MERVLRFVTDDVGRKTDVLLPIQEYESLMEDLSDLGAIADRRHEATIPHDTFLAELRRDGILQD